MTNLPTSNSQDETQHFSEKNDQFNIDSKGGIVSVAHYTFPPKGLNNFKKLGEDNSILSTIFSSPNKNGDSMTHEYKYGQIEEHKNTNHFLHRNCECVPHNDDYEDFKLPQIKSL
ncbi:hypothetical protein TCON_2146 [Astathelohania contejeani]|uniref:Uncharacterized protein n=1 Tax=Astathelohania contejeani TaxID=164912 RepID=A0ABQ7HWR8_9MICR|nr:hypothetical protein TCON_2146 [Thelohania contejeani]